MLPVSRVAPLFTALVVLLTPQLGHAQSSASGTMSATAAVVVPLSMALTSSPP